MKTNEAKEIIMHFEGFRAEPYRCSAKVWTIGYGSTRSPSGKHVTIDTPDLSESDAETWLAHDCKRIRQIIKRLVKVPLVPCQDDALVSFIYNVGSGNFAASTLRSRLNRYDYEGAAMEFPKWRIANGRVSPGLVRRRKAEQLLFLTEM